MSEPTSSTPHPLLNLLDSAARGDFPPTDGQAVLLPPLNGGQQAVVSFTAHAVLATQLTEAELADLQLDGYGRALHPRTLSRLAGEYGRIGVVDVMMVAFGTGLPGSDGASLTRRDDLREHPRVKHATALRRDVRVFGDNRGLVTLAKGLAGRTELSIEVTGEHGTGLGRSLLSDALSLVPAREPVFAAVSPGNARSLRAFLAVGFVPLGSEVVIAH